MTNNAPVMLPSDKCYQGFHLCCLSPPLPHVPRGNWYCSVENSLQPTRHPPLRMSAHRIQGAWPPLAPPVLLLVTTQCSLRLVSAVILTTHYSPTPPLPRGVSTPPSPIRSLLAALQLLMPPSFASPPLPYTRFTSPFSGVHLAAKIPFVDGPASLSTAP